MSTSTITVNGNPVTLVPLPTDPAPRMVEPWVQDSVAIVTFPFTGQTQAQSSSGADLWGMMVTYASLSAAQAPALLAWLLGMRGMFNAVQMAPPEYQGPQGIANANLVPDSGLEFNFLDWAASSAASSFAIRVGDAGPMNEFILYSATQTTYADEGALNRSIGISVTPGFTYTLSAFVNVQSLTIPAGGGYPGLYVYDSATNLEIAQLAPVPGSAPGRVSTTFTIPATTSNIYLCPQTRICTCIANFSLEIGAMMLQPGTVATPFVASGAPVLYGAQVAAATSLVTNGWPVSTANLLLPFDCIQVGYRLHRVLDVVSSDATGAATFRIWPSLREDQPTGTRVITNQPLGLFRLANNKRNWSVDEAHLTHLSFPLVEYR